MLIWVSIINGMLEEHLPALWQNHTNAFNHILVPSLARQLARYVETTIYLIFSSICTKKGRTYVGMKCGYKMKFKQ